MPEAEDCIFCAIEKGDAESALVYEDEDHIAFMDLFPINEGHTLVVPRKHYRDALVMPFDEAGRLFARAAAIAPAVKAATGADGINIGQNTGSAAGQIVFHTHVHIIPRHNRERGRWPGRRRSSMEKMREWATKIRAALDAQKD